MEKKNVAQSIAEKQQMREQKKRFVKQMKEYQSEEWKKICEEGKDGLYVYHSDEECDNFNGTPLRLRKVTVVGFVKKQEDGTYNLQIGWSRCHPKDHYLRKSGNLIAAKRAINTNQTFEFEGLQVRPIVLTGFKSNLVKTNFLVIAKMLVSIYEDVYDTENGIYYPTTDAFLFHQAGMDSDFEK